MSDFGIKLTLPGSDVSTASDTQLLFSSSWPSIKVFKNIFIQQTIPAFAPTPVQLYTHGLNFIPAVIPYAGVNGTNTSNGTASINRQNIGADTQNLYLLSSGSL